MTQSNDDYETENPQKPAMRGQVTNVKTNIRIESSPITMRVHEAYRGATAFIRLGSENIIQINVTDDDGSRATARAELEEDDLRELYEEIGEVLEDE